MAFTTAFKDGQTSKDHFETLIKNKDPDAIDIKASLKEKFRSLTQARQPKPGPGAYPPPTQFVPTTKPFRHQYFGSTSARFQGSMFHKGVGNGIDELGPGSYALKEDIKEREGHKNENFKKNQEIIAFHKLRQLFPDKTSISTAQLNKIKQYENEHLGPGVYTKASDYLPKAFAAVHTAAFGAN